MGACDEADASASLSFETQLSGAMTRGATPPTSSELPDRDESEASIERDALGSFSNLCANLPAATVTARGVALKCSPQAAGELARFRGSDRRELALLPVAPERPPKEAAATLATMITRLHSQRKRLQFDRLKAVAHQLTRALAHAAGLGVCHHDVCPANINIVLYRGANVMAQMTGWDAGPSLRLSPYSAPELFLSPESVIMEHRKADVWSLGMVFIEAARGSPLVKTDPELLDPHLPFVRMMLSLGTPCETAQRVLDPHTSPDPAVRRIGRKPWGLLLKESALKVTRNRRQWQLLDAMLDWNPETRGSAVSLLCFPYFSTSHTEIGKHSSATPPRLTDAELRGIISLAFAAHASHVGPAGAEAASSCVRPRSPTRERPTSKGGHGGIRLGPIEEDSAGERGSRASSRRSSFAEPHCQ
jgi:hypothetical protein